MHHFMSRCIKDKPFIYIIEIQTSEFIEEKIKEQQMLFNY